MGKIYRVTVVEETTDDRGGYEGSETLFELAGSAAMLTKIVPGALSEALLAADQVVTEAPERVIGKDGEQVAATVPADPFRQSEVKPPRRPRRTKAQIEADEAAARAGGAPEPEQAPTQVEQGNAEAVAAVASVPDAAASQPATSVTTTFAGAAPITPPQGDAAPAWNPFVTA